MAPIFILCDGTIKVKPARLAVPPADSTNTEPLAPVPTMAVMCVGESTVKVFAATDAVLLVPKRTAAMPVKFVPRITTRVPAVALAGVKLVMVGCGRPVCWAWMENGASEAHTASTRRKVLETRVIKTQKKVWSMVCSHNAPLPSASVLEHKNKRLPS